MVLWVLMATAMLGFAGLVIDGSNLQATRRKLQNAADAAVFAGAQDLPSSSSQATTDSVQWLTKNGSGSTEVTTNAVTTTTIPNDTLTVSVKRNVPYFFAQILGHGANHDVTATAKVTVQAVTGISTSDAAYMPYAVWYEDLNAIKHQIGDIVPFRSDSWVQESISNNNPGWSSNSKSFKGYSPASSGQVNVNDVIAAGTGNKCGQEPIAALQKIYQNNGTITVVLNDQGSGNGANLNVVVVGFVTLYLNVPNQSINQGCGQGDFIGKIVNFSTSRGVTGGTPPQSWASCGTGIGACKAVLSQ
ncbi:MAG: Tad domain-containing protein [Dehalococcoidia bacterium]